MAKNAIEIVNPDALTEQIRALEAGVSESTLRRAAVAGARVILAETKLRVPRATGEGASQLIIAYDSDVSVTGKIASYIVTWTKAAYYLRFIEFGTSKMAAKPFLRPAFEAKKTAAAQAVSDAIQNDLKG